MGINNKNGQIETAITSEASRNFQSSNGRPIDDLDGAMCEDEETEFMRARMTNHVSLRTTAPSSLDLTHFLHQHVSAFTVCRALCVWPDIHLGVSFAMAVDAP